MNSTDQAFFDEQLERVLAELPDYIRALLPEIPVIVDDRPSSDLMRQIGVRHPDELCGLYSGIPLNQRSIDHSARLPDVIHIFRRGIFAAAQDERGRVSERELRRQIRLTILHEFGHYHGLEENELEELGY
jgi:predicted Zn-dependent protease with MMP-like domain